MKTVFIDRDGVINRAIPRKEYKLPTAPFCMEELEFFPGISDALCILRKTGFLCILVSNQPDVAYGNMSEEEWQKIEDEVEKFGFDDVFLCCHGRDENCFCRKPKPGLLFSAAEKLGLDLSVCYLIGDTNSDMEAAKRAGCKAGILVRTDYNYDVKSDYMVQGILGAAKLIQMIEGIEGGEFDENIY